jgi:eukaryotic-like serine/threonine-protein kinase
MEDKKGNKDKEKVTERVHERPTAPVEAHPTADPLAHTVEKMSHSSEHVLPVKEWDRYEIIEFLGEGGMGRVYKAFDPRLKRFVALKFIRGEAPTLIQRFMREAQSQASIEHENVCKVYEAGEIEDKLYIAMQYIAGYSLKDLPEDVTLEQKIKIMKETAEGLQAAHRLGIIHRDIKPGNIMVEQEEDGSFHSYIMDFGLARDLGTAGLTESGAILGTPWYMSPEQVRGELNKLDRRSDIYSFGATMYELLAGTPPFAGESSVEVFMKVINDEVTPLRRIKPFIPVDLETIVMKCLEKDPLRRYESARAVAEDLQHYLEGEPIAARRDSIFYVLGKKAQKHKVVLGITMAALLIIITLALIGLHTRRTAQQQAALAYQYGQEVKSIESILRYAYMLPLHDISFEKKMVIDKLKNIETQMQHIGSIGKGPGHFALGRGYASLSENKKAREHLEQAWNAGYQEPDVAYALGKALGELYKEEHIIAARITDKNERESRLAKIEKEYRQPSLFYLKKGARVETEAPEYAEALLAYYARQWETALQKSRIALNKIPWLYESKLLEGDIYTEQGMAARDTGEHAAALQYFSQARTSYQKAIVMARSDWKSYEGLCQAWNHKADIELETSKSPEASVANALNACHDALTANPESASGYQRIAYSYSTLAEYQFHNGENPVETLNKSIAAAQHAITIAPDNVEAYVISSVSQWFIGWYELDKGADPRQALQKSIATADHGLAINPNSAPLFINRGIAYKIYAEYELDQRMNPYQELSHAIESYENAIRNAPTMFTIYSNLGSVYRVRAEWETRQNQDPHLSYQKAVEVYMKGIKINPNNKTLFNNLGNVFTIQGDYEMNHGQDPRDSYARAISHYQKAVEISPGFDLAYQNMGEANLGKAIYELNSGLNPLESLDKALLCYNKSFEINASRYQHNVSKGFAFLVKARFEFVQNMNPEPSLNQSISLFKDVLKQRPDDINAHLGLADAYMWLAKIKLQAHKNSETDLHNATQHLQIILSKDSKSLDVLNRQALLEILQARLFAFKNQSPFVHLNKASAILEQAYSLNSYDSNVLLSRAELFRYSAEWHKNNKELFTRDLAKANEALDTLTKVYPNMPEAKTIKSDLKLWGSDPHSCLLRGMMLLQ